MPMQASVSQDCRILCPICASARYTRLRREVMCEHVLRIHCLCDSCNQVFNFREDRFGRRYP